MTIENNRREASLEGEQQRVEDVTEELLEAYFSNSETRFEFDTYLRELLRDPKVSAVRITIKWRDEWNVENSPVEYLPVRLKAYAERYPRRVQVKLHFSSQDQLEQAGRHTFELYNVINSGIEREIG